MTRIRKSVVVGLFATALAVLIASSPSEARRDRERIEIGSVLIEAGSGGNLAPLVGLVLVANEGFEKTVTYPLPKLASTDMSVTGPLFLMRLNVDDDGLTPTIRELDSLLFLTNTNAAGGASLMVKVTFRRADGSTVMAAGNATGNPLTVTIMPGQTVVVSAASAINP